DPGTYTWIPFGGGRRRCVGASFAQLEMAIVLRELLRVSKVAASIADSEATVRRAITAAPARGGETVLTGR
ncbi:MAG: cytochrome family, partial [Actinomycetota bacterium]|nr:cytochrome family [Actinomycetota bacterium]